MNKSNLYEQTDLINIINMAPESNYQLADPNLVDYYKELKLRRIWITDTIEPDYMAEICRCILRWNQDDDKIDPLMRQPIIMCFNSPGGSLYAYLMLKDIINLSATPIHGILMSETASAAALIFLNTHRRFSLPNATLTLHYGSIQLGGDAQNVTASMNQYYRELDNLKADILAHSNISKEELEKKLVNDWILNANDMLKYGMCHNIVDNLAFFWE